MGTNDEFGLDEAVIEKEVPEKVVAKTTRKKKVVESAPKAPEFYTIVIDQVEGQPNYETVGVHGKDAPNKAWQIQRGKRVEVPACVVEVLSNSIAGKVIDLPEGGYEVHDYNLVPFRIMAMR